MILTKLLFIVLIIICAFFYILYVWDFALVLLVVIAALPVILFISTFIAKKMIQVEFAVKDKNTTKNKDFPIQLVVTNRSIIPIGKAEAHVEYFNVFNDQISSFDIYLPIQARNSQRITFQLRSKFSGLIRIKATHLYVYDPLKLFRFKVTQDIQTEVMVSPVGYDISGIVQYSDRVNDESDVFSENRPGDDPSEVFDLREYFPGDKINRIHWKLSSKKNDFIVKEYSLPIDVPCAVFLDLRSYYSNDYILPVFDTLIETFLSLSHFLLDNERRHSVIYFDPSRNDFTEQNIGSTSDISYFIKRLFTAFSNGTECEKPEKCLNDLSASSYASFSVITSSPDLSFLDTVEEGIDADIKNAFVILESENKLSEIDGIYSSLKVNPVIIGRISASIKDIEI